MKRFLLLLLAIILILTSCAKAGEDRILRKLNKALDKYEGYETEAEIKILMGDKETNYKIKEKYSKDKDYKVEILEPKESKGITIEYDKDKIILNHASIRQSITLKNLKNFNKGFLIGEFFHSINSVKSIEEEKIDHKELYVLKFKLKDKNKYNKEQIIYLNKKDFTPYMMNILDDDKNPRVIVKYKKFKFIKKNDI